MIYATMQPSKFDNLQANLDLLRQTDGSSGLLLDSMQVAVDNVQPTPPVDVIYTDDWSPIEWVTNRMILSYVLFGDLQEIGH
jgi:hypothetical protein